MESKKDEEHVITQPPGRREARLRASEALDVRPERGAYGLDLEEESPSSSNGADWMSEW